MAKHTNLALRQMTVYQIFPRQYSKSQNFNGITNDLPRLKKLGVDIIYLTPIHPIGSHKRKGNVGSPYAIKDYYAIDPAYGTLSDFKLLIEKAHSFDIKIMMDIVINHTSRDSKLLAEHPQWFYKNAKGEFANRVGDWSDITDLDYKHRGIWNYMQDMLSYWAQFVDGFRCDVAPLIPLDFWQEARAKIDKIKPELIWLTESVEPGFIKYLRDMDYECSTDSQMYQVFDICYDYDIFNEYKAYLKDGKQLNTWIQAIRRQETMYPSNYVKLRSYENHDQERLRSLVRDENHFKQMIAFMFFLKGTAFLYAGMEHQVTHRPSLFENDLISWNEEKSIESFITQLTKIKKHHLFKDGHFDIHVKDDVVVAQYKKAHELMLGIFNLENKAQIKLDLSDGKYKNLINQEELTIKDQQLKLNEKPIILLIKDQI